MMRFLSVVVALGLAGPAVSQDSSLADIRSELGVLNAEINRLKSELNTTGTGGGVAVTGDTLQRIDAIEAGLTRLNAKTEQLENRINRVVTDGTNRIGDLEFRLVELEGGDLSTVGQTPTLGGDTGAAPAAQVAVPQNDAPELAIGEKNDFERAEGALASGDFRSAAEQFATFTQSYPGSPLEADAHYMRGEALAGAGDPQGAARAYLESFSGSPDSARAPSALRKLGMSLDALGQRNEACLMLTEVGNRYPASDQVVLANQSRASLGCS